MAEQTLDLSLEEELFLGLIQAEGFLTEVKEDKSEVLIDGVNRGSFEDTKAIFSTQWISAQDNVSKSTTKQSGIIYNTITCSATDLDLQSVTATTTAMAAITGQTNVDILFANGEKLILADDADLASFLAVWYPFRTANSTGYSFTEDL